MYRCYLKGFPIGEFLPKRGGLGTLPTPKSPIFREGCISSSIILFSSYFTQSIIIGHFALGSNKLGQKQDIFMMYMYIKLCCIFYISYSFICQLHVNKAEGKVGMRMVWEGA